MAEYTGENLYVQWVGAGGTVTLQGDFRTFSIKPTIGLAKATAGADPDEVYLATVKDAQMSWAGVAQAGGTLLEDALVEGTSGTLYVGPEGTATGKRKWTIPAIALGASFNIPYADTVEVACDFQKSGALVRGVW
jgi:hypothetical protein